MVCVDAGATNAAVFFYGGHMYETVSSAVSWSAAVSSSTASRYGAAVGYLASIESDAENAAVISQSGSGEFWIGATDSSNPGTFVWVGGAASGAQLSYADWAVGQPDELPSRTCVYVSAKKGWNDDLCNITRAYLVEYACDAGFSFTYDGLTCLGLSN